jgi:hypothetical protein
VSSSIRSNALVTTVATTAAAIALGLAALIGGQGATGAGPNGHLSADPAVTVTAAPAPTGGVQPDDYTWG